ncbi:MAG: MFS transporter [Acidothermaceae bacterium]
MHIAVASPRAILHLTASRAVSMAAQRVGGHRKLRAITLLAGVIALDGADKGTVSATASDIKQTFHVGNTQIGVLLTVVSIVSAVLTVPMGVLTDRISRTRLLAISIVGWAVAVLVSGMATSFIWLLLSQLGLAAVAAAAGPAVASLTGDLFPPDERGAVYGQILVGELIGTGLGLVGSTFITGILGWRWAFWWLVPPTLFLAWVVHRMPEPERERFEGSDEPQAERDDALRQAIEGSDVEPRPEMVLHSSPADMKLWSAVRYVLRIPTNRVLIAASALGYFFFAGLRGFAIAFAQDHYGLSKTDSSGLMLVVGAGAVAGAFFGGRLADRLIDRGVIAGRVWVPAVALLTVPVMIGPALWATQVVIALPLLVIGAAMLSAANPAQDAARLDIVHPRLWGRSESIRTLARTALEASAPLLFGYTSERLLGGDGPGLQATFLIFLVALPAAGAMGLAALRTYPRDVATAQASIDRLDGDDGQSD